MKKYTSAASFSIIAKLSEKFADLTLLPYNDKQGSNAIIVICSKVLESGKIRVSEKELDRLDKISDEEGNVPRLEHIVDLILDWPSKFLRLFKRGHMSHIYLVSPPHP